MNPLMADNYEELWLLPVKSQEFMQGPQLLHTLSELKLRFDYELPDGKYAWSALIFKGVEAFEFTGHSSCTRDQVRAYDRLVLVLDSNWLSRRAPDRGGLKHYRIYFDEVGCYDVAATMFEPRDDSSAPTTLP